MSQYSRRFILAGAMALAAAPAMAAKAKVTTETVEVQATPTRKSTLTVRTPARKPIGVILFSHGHGGWPDYYTALFEMFAAEGFAVVAPLHVDSHRHPDKDKYTLQTSLFERLPDARAASAYAAQRWPGLPVVASGHSLGTLISLAMAGGVPMFRLKDPTVKAVLGYSSPGKIPGIVPPTAYAGVATPVLIVTGDKDVVPTFAPDPKDHLFAIETAPAGDKYGLVLAGGVHNLIKGDDPEVQRRAVEAGRTFLRAYIKDDAKAKKVLQAKTDAPPEHWIVR
ncbi:MAG: alpha/beta hydrolase [Phenylobacterium zucineum]|nr:MAG: alpha/beta hydrolase [Phenylobacterium zucineum]